MPDNNTRVMTAALAVIKVAGQAVGRMRSIRVTETFRRGDVRGLGEILSQERPVVGWDGSMTCGFYTIDLKRLGNVASSKFGLNRQAGDLKTFVNTLILNEQGFEIYIYKKMAEVVDAQTGLVTSVGEGEFAVIENALPENQSFDINEGAISGTDMSFSYLNPILFDPATT
jgi:hypothetical protein